MIALRLVNGCISAKNSNELTFQERFCICLPDVLARTFLICSRAIQSGGRDWDSRYTRVLSISQLDCFSDSKSKPLNDIVQKIKVARSYFCNLDHRPCSRSSSSLFDSFLIRRTGTVPLSRTSFATDSSLLCTQHSGIGRSSCSFHPAFSNRAEEAGFVKKAYNGFKHEWRLCGGPKIMEVARKSRQP